MKNFKRKLAGFLIFAMVLGIMAPGVVAQAAEMPTVQFDVYGDSATIDANATLNGIAGYTVRYAQYTGATNNATGKSVDVSKIKSWETVEKKSATDNVIVDLSWCNKTKDSTVVFEFTKKGQDPYYVAQGFKAQPKAIKVALVAATSSTINNGPTSIPEDCLVGSKDTGYLCFYDATSKAVISPTSICYNKAFSYDHSNNKIVSNLKKYMAKGTTFSFVLNADEDKDGNIVWPSKTAKFSYKKQANAPTVSFDVSKHTITIKKGQEYQVLVDGDDTGVDTWYKVDDYNMEGSKVTKNRLEDLVVSVSEDGKTNTYLTDAQLYSGDVVIKVRTAASTKSPSKIATIPVNVVTTGTSVDFTVGAATTASIQVAYTTVKTDGGVTVKNTTSSAYEVAIAASATGITATTKWVALTAAGGKKDTVKLATKNIENPVVYVREAGVKAKKATKTTPAQVAQLSGYAEAFNLKDLDKPDPRVTKLEIVGTTVSNSSITLATGGAVGKATFELAIATGSAVEDDTEVTLKFTYADLKLTKATAISVSGTEKGKVLAVPTAKVATSTDNSYTGEVKVTIKKGAATGTKTLTFKVGANDPGFEVKIDVKNK